MALFGAISVIALRVGDGRTSGLIGLVAGVSAAPGLLVAGAPLADDAQYPLAVLASVPLWLFLGFVASRRATASPIPEDAPVMRKVFVSPASDMSRVPLIVVSVW